MKLAAALLLVLALAGCTATPAPAPVPSPTPTQEAAPVAELLPVALAEPTGEAAQAEGTRVADALQALVDGILNVDDNSQLIPAASDVAAYYGVYRVITLDAAVDPLVMGAQLTTVLQQSGWSVYETTNDSGVYLSALSSGDTGWFALIGGDATVEGQPVVTFQIASPDLPST